MPVRYYLADRIGTGTLADPRRPRIASGVNYGGANIGAGKVWVEADVSPAQHTAMLAVAGVIYLPFEDAGGAIVPLDSPLSNVSSANRTLIRDRCAAAHIPDDGITLASPCRAVVRRILLRLILRQVLGPDDLTEGLDTLVSAIPLAKRQAIRAKLVAHGIDFDGVLGTDTIREAIRKIVVQNARVFIVGL